jgi:hypothetical protein
MLAVCSMLLKSCTMRAPLFPHDFSRSCLIESPAGCRAGIISSLKHGLRDTAAILMSSAWLEPAVPRPREFDAVFYKSA